MSRKSVPVGTHGWGYVAHRRPGSADVNFELLAALGGCVAFWAVVLLTAYWLI
jgi:hypothetical protein